jgi:protein SCO1/2
MRDRRTCLLWLAAALAGCSPTAPQPPGVLDISGADYGRDFRLQDPSGAWRTLADFRGKAVMVFFGFAQCPDVCPTALFKAAESLQALGGDAAKVQVLFISLDPERDTPEILKSFAGAFHPSVIALRGDADLTRQTAEHFKVFYRKVPLNGSYTIDHTALVYLYDPAGKLRRALRPAITAQQQAEQVRALLQGG